MGMSVLRFKAAGHALDSRRGIRRTSWRWIVFGVVLLAVLAAPRKIFIEITAVPQTAGPLLLVSGMINDPAATEVNLIHDGQSIGAVRVRDGKFSAPINLRPEWNTLEARTDRASSKPVRVFLVPTLRLREPPAPAANGLGELQGTVENSSRDRVRLVLKQGDGAYGPPVDVPIVNGAILLGIPIKTSVTWAKAFIEFEPPVGAVESNEVKFLGTETPLNEPLATRVLIDTPTEWTDTETATVAGRIEGPEVPAVTLLVNGSPQPPVKVTNRSFTASLKLFVGPNTVTAWKLPSNWVTFERRQPVVKISSPVDGTEVCGRTIQVSGVVSDSRSRVVRLRVNEGGESEVPVSNGAFSSNVPIAPGTNVIAAIIPNAEPGGITVKRREPAVSIASPTNNTQTLSESVRVSGTVTEACGSTVNVSASGQREQEVPIVAGRFSADVRLDFGRNVIRAWAPGSETTVVVTRIALPVVKIVDPAQNAEVTDALISVKGTVEHSTSRSISLRVDRTNGANEDRRVPVENGVFKTSIRLGIGDNTVQAHLANLESNKVTITRVEPVITIIRPALNQQVDGEATVVAGTLEHLDAQAVSIDVLFGTRRVSTYTAEVRDHKFLEPRVKLFRRPNERATTNVIKVSISGNPPPRGPSAQVTVFAVGGRVNPDTQPLRIQITSPTRQNRITFKPDIRIEGKVSSSQTTAITVTSALMQPNNRPSFLTSQTVEARDGLFRANVELRVGRNRIQALTASGSAPQAKDEIIVVRRPELKEPSLLNKRPIR